MRSNVVAEFIGTTNSYHGGTFTLTKDYKFTMAAWAYGAGQSATCSSGTLIIANQVGDGGYGTGLQVWEDVTAGSTIGVGYGFGVFAGIYEA